MTLVDAPIEQLRGLAQTCGVMLEYTDLEGRHHEADPHALAAILQRMGGESHPIASSPLASGHVHVVRRGDESESVVLLTGATARRLHARVSIATSTTTSNLRVEQSDGSTWQLMVPPTIPFGYHRLTLRWHDDEGQRRSAHQLLVVAPATALPASASLRGQRGIGIGVDLYAVRRNEDWGMGDFGALASAIALAATSGLDYVGLPPLHSTRSEEHDISPYSPVSRLFLNTLYIDPSQVPEWADCRAAHVWLETTETRATLAALRNTPLVDYDGVRAFKDQLFAFLWRTFREHATASRRRDFDAFCTERHEELTRFATFVALDKHLRARGYDSPASWPAGYRSPHTSAVRSFASRHRDAVEFHRWLQFEADRQLGELSRRARADLRLGLYLDLAIGTSENGYDLWAHPHFYLGGAAAGSPPDYFNPRGQDWGLPPLNPLALQTSDGCLYFATLVRANLRHAAMLRIDHAAALHRLYVIPRPLSAEQGLYLRMPEEILTAVIAIESHRHGAVIIGEDLGNVPDTVRTLLAREHALGYRVLLFEQRYHGHGQGYFLPSHAWATEILATATTHDTAMLRAWYEGTDIAQRLTLGLLHDREEHETRATRERDIEALLATLRQEGLLPFDGLRPPYSDFAHAAHCYLAKTPARLVEVRLANLGAGETTPVNVPGVGPEHYPTWRPKMMMTIEQLSEDDRQQAKLRELVRLRQS